MISGDDIVSRQRLRSAWRRIADAVMPPPVILMYHRIAQDRFDPWKLCVSPRNFVAQMAFIRCKRRPMRLAELTERLGRGQCPRGAVVVTFDDGYSDNLHAALPVLRSFEVPATVFCTAGFIGRDDAFWWDRLASLLLGPESLPPVLTLDVGGAHRGIELGSTAGGDARGARLHFYREVWARLRPLTEHDRAAALAYIARWSGAGPVDAPQPLSHDEARRLAASPLIEIGAHSMTHAALPTLVPAAQRHEIAQSKARLEALFDRPVASFAYPFGDLNADTVALVREAGFRSSCTTEAAAVRAGADVLRLPRIAIGDWDAPTLAGTLRGTA